MILFQWLAPGVARVTRLCSPADTRDALSRIHLCRLSAAWFLALMLGMLWAPAYASFPATPDPTVCTVAPCYVYNTHMSVGTVIATVDRRGTPVQMLSLPGERNGEIGVYEYIKNSANQIYHRFFNPK